MAVRIKLTRLGKIRNPQYRIVVADARTRRDGRAIETIGTYQPKEEPSFIQIDSERAQYWLGVGDDDAVVRGAHLAEALKANLYGHFCGHSCF